MHFNPNIVSRGVLLNSHFPPSFISSAVIQFFSKLSLLWSCFSRPCLCLHEREVAVVASLSFSLVILYPAGGGGVLLLPAAFFPCTNKAEQVRTQPYNPQFASFFFFFFFNCTSCLPLCSLLCSGPGEEADLMFVVQVINMQKKVLGKKWAGSIIVFEKYDFLQTEDSKSFSFW